MRKFSKKMDEETWLKDERPETGKNKKSFKKNNSSELDLKFLKCTKLGEIIMDKK